MIVRSHLPIIDAGKDLCLRLGSPGAEPETGIWLYNTYGGKALRRKRIMESENSRGRNQARMAPLSLR